MSSYYDKEIEERSQYVQMLQEKSREAKSCFSEMIENSKDAPAWFPKAFLFAYVQLLGLMALLSFIFVHGRHVDKDVLDNPFSKFLRQHLKIDEFYEELCLLPTLKAREIIALFDCSISVQDELIEYKEAGEKEEFKKLIRANEIDINKYSHFVRECILSGNISFKKEATEEDVQNIKFHINQFVSFYNSLQPSEQKKCEVTYILMTTLMTISKKRLESDLDNDTVDEEAKKIFEELTPNLEKCYSMYKKALYRYWDNKDVFDDDEQKAIETICEPYREQLYDKIYQEYLLSKGNFMPSPPDFTAEQLSTLYEKIHEYCPAGQNFMYFFGYGDRTQTNNSPHLIWNKTWKSLAYFIKVLYGKPTIHGKQIQTHANLDMSIYTATLKIFRNKKGKPPKDTTIISNSVDRCKDGNLEGIFIEVLQSTADSK
jgi:hypothetical protein